MEWIDEMVPTAVVVDGGVTAHGVELCDPVRLAENRLRAELAEVPPARRCVRSWVC